MESRTLPDRTPISAPSSTERATGDNSCRFLSDNPASSQFGQKITRGVSNLYCINYVSYDDRNVGIFPIIINYERVKALSFGTK